MTEFINTTPDDSALDAFLNGLRDRDAALWSDDPAVQAGIRDRLGWLDAGAFMDEQAARINGFADRVREEGYQRIVLLGMGGSSLAPEVYAALFGSDALKLTVADSTAPRHVAAITQACETAATLFIVASKSGTTAETSALEAHFFEWARARFDHPGRHFVAITDPGSPLADLAAGRGYRRTFLNPADIGGRFSALSHFGLVPAALAGADLAALRTHVPEPGGDAPLCRAAGRLGLALGALARTGRNKLTLQLSPTLAPLAAWIEQLIDESTGKAGTGIVVVAGEDRLPAGAYGDDRVFVAVELAGEALDPEWLGAVAGAGHPLLRWGVPGLNRLGAEYYRWQVATAAAGRSLGVNPFDEPDVNDAKTRTRAFLQRAGEAASMPAEPVSAVASLLRRIGPGDYIALLAYLPPSPGVTRRLLDCSARLGRLTGLPCCPAFGPRYLHSSGQLHKGGPDQGLFIVLTQASDFDVPIPGQPHGFRSLIDAQAWGDLQALKERGRRAVHFRLGDGEAGLDELIAALATESR